MSSTQPLCRAALIARHLPPGWWCSCKCKFLPGETIEGDRDLLSAPLCFMFLKARKSPRETSVWGREELSILLCAGASPKWNGFCSPGSFRSKRLFFTVYVSLCLCVLCSLGANVGFLLGWALKMGHLENSGDMRESVLTQHPRVAADRGWHPHFRSLFVPPTSSNQPPSLWKGGLRKSATLEAHLLATLLSLASHLPGSLQTAQSTWS